MADENENLQNLIESITEAEAKILSLRRKLDSLTEGTSEHVEIKLKQLEVQKQLERLYAKENNDFTQLTATIDRLNQEVEELTSNLEDSIKPAESLAESFAGLVGLGDDLNTTFAGKLIKSMKGGSAAATAFSARLKNMAHPANLAAYALQTVFDQTAKLTSGYSEAFASIAKDTTNFVTLNDNLISTEERMRGTAVSVGELAESISTLYPTVTGFTQMTNKQQNVLIETTAVLEEMGVASATTAENIQFGTKVLGMSVKEVDNLQRELFTFAKQLGVPAKQVATDFEGLHGIMAALGDDPVDSFRALEVQFKATGIAATRIVSIVEQFDTFDRAAQAAGRLNALLGGPFLNSLEMVSEVDPAKRFDMLRDSLVGAGVAFDDLDYYQKKAMANALGLEDASELALLLGDRMDLIHPPVKTADEIMELKIQMSQFNTVMDNLTQAGMAFAISMGPMVLWMRDMASGLAFVINGFNDLTTALGPFWQILKLVGSAVAIYFGGPIMTALAAVTGLMNAVSALAHIFYHDAGSPSFIDMLSETAGAFGELGAASEITAEQTVKINPALRSGAATMHQVESASNSLSSPGAVKTKVTQGTSGMGGTSAPKIEIKLQIGDQEFASKVNSVKVNGMSGGGALADSITKLLIKGLEGA